MCAPVSSLSPPRRRPCAGVLALVETLRSWVGAASGWPPGTAPPENWSSRSRHRKPADRVPAGAVCSALATTETLVPVPAESAAVSEPEPTPVPAAPVATPVRSQPLPDSVPLAAGVPVSGHRAGGAAQAWAAWPSPHREPPRPSGCPATPGGRPDRRPPGSTRSLRRIPAVRAVLAAELRRGHSEAPGGPSSRRRQRERFRVRCPHRSVPTGREAIDNQGTPTRPRTPSDGRPGPPDGPLGLAVKAVAACVPTVPVAALDRRGGPGDGDRAEAGGAGIRRSPTRWCEWAAGPPGRPPGPSSAPTQPRGPPGYGPRSSGTAWPVGTAVGGADVWWHHPVAGGVRVARARERADARPPTSAGGGALLTVCGGVANGAGRAASLLLAALVAALASARRGGVPARVVGWWPDCGRAWIVPVDAGTLSMAADGVAVAAAREPDRARIPGPPLRPPASCAQTESRTGAAGREAAPQGL